MGCLRWWRVCAGKLDVLCVSDGLGVLDGFGNLISESWVEQNDLSSIRWQPLQAVVTQCKGDGAKTELNADCISLATQLSQDSSNQFLVNHGHSNCCSQSDHSSHSGRSSQSGQSIHSSHSCHSSHSSLCSQSSHSS